MDYTLTRIDPNGENDRYPLQKQEIVTDPPAVGWLLFFIAVSGLAVFIPRWSFRWVWQRRTEAQLARLISRTDAEARNVSALFLVREWLKGQGRV